MPEIKRSALVVHAPGKVFELVRDVPRYPEFLSWCTAAEIHRESPEEQEASLTLRVAGVSGRFTTVNRLAPGRRVDMLLERSRLFRALEGHWLFQPVGPGCRVSLVLGFEFDNRLVAAAFRQGFARVADRLVADFCARADSVYG